MFTAGVGGSYSGAAAARPEKFKPGCELLACLQQGSPNFTAFGPHDYARNTGAPVVVNKIFMVQRSEQAVHAKGV
jgi:hypothetical protein